MYLQTIMQTFFLVAKYMREKVVHDIIKILTSEDI